MSKRKYLTNRSIVFGAIGTLASVVFFYYLDQGIAEENLSKIMNASLMYAAVWFISGFALGIGDSERNYRGDLGMLYHIVSSVVALVSGSIAVVVFDFIIVADLGILASILAVSLLVHYFGTRKEIKGMDKPFK